MIDYDVDFWGCRFAFAVKGSVFPKSAVWAVPGAALAMGLHMLLKHTGQEGVVGIGEVGTTVLGSFNFILGFLLVFRTQTAFARWWEGGTLLQELRGEWFNAFSSCIAFCNTSKKKEQDVEAFRHQFARLLSALHGAALTHVATLDAKDFELLDLDAFEPQSFAYAQHCYDRCEVILHWIQRLIVEAAHAETIKVPAPFLSSTMSQLSNGIVKLNSAAKITHFPIPFPLAQMITMMLLLHWVSTIVICAAGVQNTFWVGALSFVVIISFWSINYIALELEMPFGDDLNDLPMHEMQHDLNSSIRGLMHDFALRPPVFEYNQSVHPMLLSQKTNLTSFASEMSLTSSASGQDDGTSSRPRVQLRRRQDHDVSANSSPRLAPAKVRWGGETEKADSDGTSEPVSPTLPEVGVVIDQDPFRKLPAASERAVRAAFSGLIHGAASLPAGNETAVPKANPGRSWSDMTLEARATRSAPTAQQPFGALQAIPSPDFTRVNSDGSHQFSQKSGQSGHGYEMIDTDSAFEGVRLDQVGCTVLESEIERIDHHMSSVVSELQKISENHRSMYGLLCDFYGLASVISISLQKIPGGTQTPLSPSPTVES